MLIEVISFCTAVLIVLYLNEEDWPQDFLMRSTRSHNLRQILFSEMKPNYQIGLGRADITGPAADVNMVRNKLFNFRKLYIYIV